MTTNSDTVYQARILSVEDLHDGVKRLRVEKPADSHGRAFTYRAGQYTLLSLGGLAPKPFSIASHPDDTAVEFHIRNTGQGDGAAVLEQLQVNDPVTLSGARGEAYWRDCGRPVLALSGGTGVSPVLSIARQHLAAAPERPFHLYWGARTAAHLYIHADLCAIAETSMTLRYHPVLSEDPAAGRAFRHGMIDAALAADFTTLAGYTIYLSGPPAMVHALLPQLRALHADPAFIFGDGLAITK